MIDLIERQDGKSIEDQEKAGSIRIVIADDSMFMRTVIRKILENDPEIRVVGAARNGKEAVRLVKELKPDLVTLDIEMPVMDGMTALRTIMKESPCPVMMISSLTVEGSRATLEALDLGAVDFIPKVGNDLSGQGSLLRRSLLEKVKACAGSSVKSSRKAVVRRPGGNLPTVLPPHGSPVEIVAIGASTGGPKALQDVIPYLPATFPAVVLVAQHMPEGFTRTFAERLNSISHIPVHEAKEGDLLRPGRVLIAPGGRHLSVKRGKGTFPVVHISREPVDAPYRPSVDVMMRSVSEVYQERALAVMMTGMGHDGRDGMQKIKQRKGRTLAQDRKSCVVFGMPGAVMEVGIVDQVVPLSHLAQTIVQVTGSG